MDSVADDPDDAGPMAMITVCGLRKNYGDRRVVDGVDFEVAKGEIFGIVGPNGAGKTTTVECIGGLRKRDGGDVLVAGFDPPTATPDFVKYWESSCRRADFPTSRQSARRCACTPASTTRRATGGN